MTVDSRPGILQVVLSLDPGGTERLVVDLIRAARQQFRVAVCCIDAPGRWGLDLQAEGVDVFALHRRPGFHPILGWRLASAAAARQMRVLHCHHYSPYVYGCLAKVARPRLRVILTEHGRLSDDAPTRKRRIVTPIFAAMGADRIAVSEDLKRYMVSAGFPSGSVRVVTNGIAVGPLPSTEQRARARLALGAQPRDLVIGAVGRLDPVKHFDLLIRAFARVAREVPHARLALVGDGPERAALESLAREAGTERITLLGHREDVRELLPGLDVFANTSISEGISLTLLEAMSAGLPIVATRVGGTPEVVVDGETGVLVPARDVQACAAALTALLRSDGDRRRMGTAGRHRVAETFSLERMTGEYLRLYAALGV